MFQHVHQAAAVTVNTLRQSRLFDGIDDATLMTLTSELKTETAEAGQLLMHEGDVATHMYVVLSGEVEVVHKGDTDHDVRVALLGPGDFIGEMAVLDAQPRSASVRVLASTDLLRISADDVQRVIHRDPQQYATLVLNVARELSRRLRVADRVIAHGGVHVARDYIQQSRRS